MEKFPPLQSDDATDLTAPGARPSNASRRRALQNFGRASAAAGLASPLAALAGGSGRPWCYRDKTKTTCVQASISGVGSVVLSAQANGSENHGKSCGYYKSSQNIPSACAGLVFKNIFACSGNDSNGKSMSQGTNCLFNLTLTQLLCEQKVAGSNSSPEAHWATAYCNSHVGYNTDPAVSTYPYSKTQVAAYYSNSNMRLPAYNFFCNYMENA